MFLNCQKLRIHVDMRDLGGEKESIFERGDLDVVVDQNLVNTFKEGDIMDMCCYYSAGLEVVKLTEEKSTIKYVKSLLVVTNYPSAALSSHNCHFFSELAGLEIEYIRCDDPRDRDTVSHNFNCLVRAVNCLKFPYLEKNQLSIVKLLAVNSLMNLRQQTPLHLLIVTD